MDQIQEALRWFLSPSGRIMAAAMIFALIWAFKSIPFIKQKVLTNDRAKLIAAIVMAMAPAAAMLMDSSVPASEAWGNALMVLLAAMGIQGGLKAALGNHLKAKLKLGEAKV